MIRHSTLLATGILVFLGTTAEPLAGQHLASAAWDVGWETPRIDLLSSQWTGPEDRQEMVESKEPRGWRRVGRHVGRGTLIGMGAGALFYGVIIIVDISDGSLDNLASTPYAGTIFVIDAGLIGAGLGLVYAVVTG